MPVNLEKRDGYAVVTVDHPPVNSIGQAERADLLRICEELSAATDVRAAILTGYGRAFAAGADVREFNHPARAPHLPQIADAIEASHIPWIAALHGAAIGGGCELALACDRRLGSSDLSIGQVEVTLGIVPGAGGTQRLPRLVGFGAAIRLVSEGTVIRAKEALQMGLIDEIVDDPAARAIELIVSGKISKNSLSMRDAPLIDVEASRKARSRAQVKARGEIAPIQAIELVELSTRVSFDEGCRIERETFLTLRESQQANALRHVFFSERAARAPGAIAKIQAAEIRHAVVVGGGTMGAGIAYALARTGILVRIVETDASALTRAEGNVANLFEKAVDRGIATAEETERQRARIHVQAGFVELQEADLAIEAAYEDIRLKKQIFAELDSAVPSHAVLASNTSYLDINEIASATKRPERVLGLHFFSPPHIMRLLEVVRTDRTSDATLSTAFAIASKLKKIPVLCGVCDGFIGNRILSRCRETADRILLEGGLPWDIDQTMVEFGYPMGPYEAQDLSGLDIAFANRKRNAAKRDPKVRYVRIADRMVEENRLGRKSGVGWYRYPDGSQSVVDPLIEDLIVEESHFAGVSRRKFSSDEIRGRVLAAMINEAAQILDEGIAANPDDIDLVTIHGYGFPRWCGGLMHFAREYGFKNVVADIEGFARNDPAVWQVSRRLRELSR